MSEAALRSRLWIRSQLWVRGDERDTQIRSCSPSSPFCVFNATSWCTHGPACDDKSLDDTTLCVLQLTVPSASTGSDGASLLEG